jgi:hypothetical protein
MICFMASNASKMNASRQEYLLICPYLQFGGQYALAPVATKAKDAPKAFTAALLEKGKREDCSIC